MAAATTTAPATATATTTATTTTTAAAAPAAAAGAGNAAEGKGEEKRIITAPAAADIKAFDLEGYIANYSGHGRTQRLLFIANQARDAKCPEVEKIVLKRCADELKKTTSTTLYKEICERMEKTAGYPDLPWVDTTDRKAQAQLEKLEVELNGYKTNLIKESIRMGNNDLGDFHYERGDLNTAIKCYLRTRDYCASSQHIVQMCMAVIKVSIEMSNFAHVINYVSKAEATPDIANNKVTVAKLKACAGLAQLESRKYKMAARKFLETSQDLAATYNDIVTMQDIATYAGMCALATFDRSELKKKVIDNAAFKPFLELVPDVRDLIQDFYASRYASCLAFLKKLKPELQLDMHLHDHVNALYDKIRSKALVQYFSPFITVNMAVMAEAFGTTVDGLEKELTALIMEGAIEARIDSHNKVLHRRTTDERCFTFERALHMGRDYERYTNAMLLRVALTRNEILVKPPRADDDAALREAIQASKRVH